MRPTNSNRKRPCRICRKWFSPDPRLGERQRTCGSTECQRQWHTKKCREWNKKNRPYFQEIYLERCLASYATPVGQTAAKPLDEATAVPLPATTVQEVISIQQLVIIKYLLRQSSYRFQEVTGSQQIEITNNRKRQLRLGNSRGDSRAGPGPVS